MSGLVLFFDLLHFFIERTKSIQRFMLQLSYKCRKYKHISLFYYREQTHVTNSQYLFEKKVQVNLPWCTSEKQNRNVSLGHVSGD